MDSLESKTNILTTSENTNNENREKELLNSKMNSVSVTDTEISKSNEVDKLIDDDEEKNDDDDDDEDDEKEEVIVRKEIPVIKSDVKKDTVKESTEDNSIDKNDNNEVNISGSSLNQHNTKIKENLNEISNINKNIENNDINDDYSKHVTYNDQGEAIYTDPITNTKYRWSEEKNDWELLQSDGGADGNGNGDNKMINPYENEHYRWCSKTNQWIPKTNVIASSTIGNTVTGTTTTTAETSSISSTSTDETALETEFYKWDKESNQWIPKVQSSNTIYSYKDKDGAPYFWDAEKNAWFPKIDDEFMARYQMNYGFIDNTSSADENKSNNDATDAIVKETSKQIDDIVKETEINQSSNEEGSSGKALKRKLAEPPKWFDLPPEHNTKVYVSDLPDDITEEEFIEVMSKCGLIMRDPQTQKYKIKLYSEPNGQLKGDALCDYIKVESVDLALHLLDGYDVRGHKIKVQRAKFQMRGEYNPALKPKRKKKEKEKLQKMKEKLFDWRPEKMRGERSKHERIVIIKNLFDPELFDKEVHLIIEYQNHLREECSKCGNVRKIVIFDRHPDGVAQVMMSSPEEADLVVQMMNRRFFGQRRLIAEIWDGKTKYKIVETEAEIEKRLSNWDKYLEDEDNKSESKEKQIQSVDDKKLTENLETTNQSE